jgi:acyl-CoA synthetase (AMP-forming)/AMP-acid ligase II
LDGELYVTGRIKDLIILRGKNHYPQDLESTLDGAHAFLVPGASAAVGWESDGEEKVVVFQELDRGARNADLTPVFQAIQESLALNHELSVAGIVLLRMGSIPRTSSGKIQRYACRKGLETGTLEVVSQWTQGMSIPQGAMA